MNFSTTSKGRGASKEQTKSQSIKKTPRRAAFGKARLALIGIVAFLVVALFVSLTFVLRSQAAYSVSSPQGDVPTYSIRGEQDYMVEDLDGRRFAVSAEAISRDELRTMAQDIRYDNASLDLLEINFYTPSEEGRFELSGSVNAANSRDALEADLQGIDLAGFYTEKDLDKIWEEQDGMDVFAFAQAEKDMEQDMRESRQELEKEMREIEEMPPPEMDVPEMPELEIPEPDF